MLVLVLGAAAVMPAGAAAIPVAGPHETVDITTSTTGPQVRLVQNFGVAKTTTNGSCAWSEPAIE